MAGALLWGYDATNKVWIPLQVDANGYVKVDMSNINLDDLADVSVATPADDDLFYYDDATSLWKARKLVDADIPAAIARDAEVATAVSDHADLTTGIHSFDKSARVYKSADQSIPDATITLLTFDLELWDTDSIHDNVTNNSRLTCKTAGTYLVLSLIQFGVNSTGSRYGKVMKNNTDAMGDLNLIALPGAGVNTRINFALLIQLAVNDYLELWAWQDSGGALDVKGVVSGYTTFAMARIA